MRELQGFDQFDWSEKMYPSIDFRSHAHNIYKQFFLGFVSNNNKIVCTAITLDQSTHQGYEAALIFLDYTHLKVQRRADWSRKSMLMKTIENTLIIGQYVITSHTINNSPEAAIISSLKRRAFQHS